LERRFRLLSADTGRGATRDVTPRRGRVAHLCPTAARRRWLATTTAAAAHAASLPPATATAADRAADADAAR